MSAIHPIVLARNLHLGHGSDPDVIKGSDFTIYPKDFVFINGASGSGKTTILSALFGHLPVRNGMLEVQGVNMKNASQSAILKLRRNIGMIFQDYKLIKEWSIERNIMLPMQINGYTKEVCKEQVNRLFSHIKLAHKANRYPLELSGGEQQRVAMARAIAHNPTLLLADEPTGNLDDYSSEMIWNLLRGINQQLGITVVVVTHRMPERLGFDYKRLQIQEGMTYEFN